MFSGSFHVLPTASDRFGKQIEYAFLASSNNFAVWTLWIIPNSQKSVCGDLSSFTTSPCILMIHPWFLSGSLHIKLHTSSFQTWLHISNNKMSGSTPKLLGYLKSLVYLDFRWKRLPSQISEDLVKLWNSKVFLFKNNELSWKVPSSFENITSLHMWNLSLNEFVRNVNLIIIKLVHVIRFIIFMHC